MTTLYVATGQRLLVITGQDGQWQATEQLAGLPTQCVTTDPLRPERVYCGTFGQGLWRSADTGQTWEPCGEGITQPEIMAVAVSATERAGDWGVVYAGTEPSALFRSEDGGHTWAACPNPLAP